MMSWCKRLVKYHRIRSAGNPIPERGKEVSDGDYPSKPSGERERTPGLKKLSCTPLLVLSIEVCKTSFFSI